MGGSLGGSKSSGTTSASQNVMSEQIPYLQQLWGAATNNLSNNETSNISSSADTMSNLLQGLYGTQSGVSNYQANGGAYGDSQQYIDKLMSSMGQRSNVGTMYESIVGGNGNTYVDPLIDSLRSDAAQNVSTLQNANSLDATAAGQSGSSRQAMQNAMVTNQANKDLTSAETALRQSNYDNDMAQKMSIAKQADTNAQSEQDRLLSLIQGSQESTNSAATNTSSLQNIINSLQSGYTTADQSYWNGLNNLSNIIGNPTVLGTSNSKSSSKGVGSSGSIWG